MSALAERVKPTPNRQPLIGIDFACNDPDNGQFNRHVIGIQITRREIILDLTAKNWGITTLRGVPSFSLIDGAVRLSGRRWPIRGGREWWGNWCWNRYLFEDQVARQFLVWLHQSKKFQCEGGYEEWCDAWDADAPLPLSPELITTGGIWADVMGVAHD